MARDDDETEIRREPDSWVTPEETIERVEVERVEGEPGVPPPVGPPPGVAGEEAVVHERQTVRQREDGAIETDTVRHEERRRSPANSIGIALLVLLLLLAAAGAAYWYFSEGSQSTVPAVEGRTLDQAVEEIEDAGLDSDIVTEANDAPEGTVFRQSPSAGTEVDEGSTVTIDVSGGPDTTPVPNAVGLGEAEARDRLVDAGFEVQTQEIFAERESGTVVSQDPAAGAQASGGETVTIKVSKGSGRVDVPNVVGLSRGEAEAELSSAQLEANVVEVPSDEAEGTVVSQNPVGGQAQQGSAVRLNVSRGR